MKTLTLAILGMCFSLAAAEPASTGTQLRRAPYKEIRTKANHDPAIREAKRKELERKQQEMEEHRKKMEALRRGGATNSASSKSSINAAPQAPKPK
jgi:hypothetical protein